MPFDPKVAIGTFALALLVGGGPALPSPPCVSAWNRDPVGGVIGVQKGLKLNVGAI